MFIVNFSSLRVLPVGVVFDELCDVRVSENRVHALVVFRDVEQVGPMTCDNSFRATVPQGTVFGGAVERCGRASDDIGVENAKEAGQDDMADR